MLFLDTDIDYQSIVDSHINDDINDEENQDISTEEKMQLIARATLDRRLNARDLKLYNYVMVFKFLGYTQEEISDMLDLSRSNVNKSFEKLAGFNYIKKVQLKKGIKQMAYELKGLNYAGIVKPCADEVIRILNIANTQDTKRKLTYCSMDDYKDLKVKIAKYKENIEIIETYYDYSGNNSLHALYKKQAHSLVEDFSKLINSKGEDSEDSNVLKSSKDIALDNLKAFIKEFKERISDTTKMISQLNQFSKKLASETSVLNENEVKEVLQDENAKLILFLDRSSDEHFLNFKEKYLKYYTEFVCKFTDLVKNKNFFKLYYENKDIQMSLTEFMKIIGYKHREVPDSRVHTKRRLADSIKEFLEKANKKILTDDAAELVEEINGLLEYIESIDSKVIFDSRTIALLLFVLDYKKDISKIGLNFDTFVEMYNPDLNDKFIGYLKSKNKEKTNTNAVVTPTGIEL